VFVEYEPYCIFTIKVQLVIESLQAIPTNVGYSDSGARGARETTLKKIADGSGHGFTAAKDAPLDGMIVDYI
jgi:hypothetical protein